MRHISVVTRGTSPSMDRELIGSRASSYSPVLVTSWAARADVPATAAVLHANPGIAAVMPAQPAADRSGLALIEAVPAADPSNPALKATVTALREQFPADAKVGGAAVENLDLQAALDVKTPLVLVVILLLGHRAEPRGPVRRRARAADAVHRGSGYSGTWLLRDVRHVLGFAVSGRASVSRSVARSAAGRPRTALPPAADRSAIRITLLPLVRAEAGRGVVVAE